MGRFMRQHAVIIHALGKLTESGQVHGFGSVRAIECAVAAVPDLDASGREELFSMGNAFVLAQLRPKSLWQFAAVHLLDAAGLAGVPASAGSPRRGLARTHFA